MAIGRATVVEGNRLRYMVLQENLSVVLVVINCERHNGVYFLPCPLLTSETCCTSSRRVLVHTLAPQCYWSRPRNINRVNKISTRYSTASLVTISTNNHFYTHKNLISSILKIVLHISDVYTQCGPNVLGLIFFLNRRHKRKTHTSFFNQNKLHWHIYNFWKAVASSSFWIFFNSSVTASWISATSAKWSPFNFIFNLGNTK